MSLFDMMKTDPSPYFTALSDEVKVELERICKTFETLPISEQLARFKAIARDVTSAINNKKRGRSVNTPIVKDSMDLE